MGSKEQFDRPFPVDRAQFDAVGVAAMLLAVSAYPNQKDLRPNGLANRFFKAQMGWLMRRAKATGVIPSLPIWTPARQQEAHSITQGLRRLEYMRAAHLLFCELMMLSVQKNQSSLRGNIATVFGPDFSKATITISNNSDAALKAIATSPDKLQSAIRFHLPAFQRHEESEEIVRDVRRRYVYPYLSIAPLFTIIHSECLNQEKEAIKREWPPFLMLISNPDWAEKAIAKAEKLEPFFVQTAKRIGLSWFDERHLLRVREVSGSNEC